MTSSKYEKIRYYILKNISKNYDYKLLKEKIIKKYNILEKELNNIIYELNSDGYIKGFEDSYINTKNECIIMESNNTYITSKGYIFIEEYKFKQHSFLKWLITIVITSFITSIITILVNNLIK